MEGGGPLEGGLGCKPFDAFQEAAPWRARSSALLRGTAAGLEFVFGQRSFPDAWAEMRERLAERPDFYRGSQATAIFEGEPPAEGFEAFLACVRGHGIELRGLYGPDDFAAFAARHALPYLGAPPRPRVASFERKRAAKVVRLTDAAQSLDADFAGARADIAQRRARGEPSVPKPVFGPPGAPLQAAVVAVPAAPQTLYYRGTLRGGQALQQLGNIVIVGDVNPGAELVASGDILVFGALRGTAHAGAQGDVEARVAALELAPTQLRIATFIAADDKLRRAGEAEVAFVDNDRIAIAPYAKMGAPR